VRDRGAHRLLVGDVERERPAALGGEVGDRLGPARRGVHGPAARLQELGRGVTDPDEQPVIRTALEPELAMIE
jgi:hypothetical protein